MCLNCLNKRFPFPNLGKDRSFHIAPIHVASDWLQTSSILCMCPYQRSLISLTFSWMLLTPSSFLISTLFTLSLNVTPFILLNILISVFSRIFSSFFLIVQHSAPYRSTRLMTVINCYVPFVHNRSSIGWRSRFAVSKGRPSRKRHFCAVSGSEWNTRQEVIDACAGACACAISRQDDVDSIA